MKEGKGSAKRIRMGTVMLAFLMTTAIAAAGMPVFAEQDTVSLISYLGPEGTYTQEAAQRFFGEEERFLPKTTVAETIRMLLDGECEYAVIPQENTIGGPVYDYLDEFLAHDGLTIVGEVELPIRQALLAAKGTELKDIEVVYSHAQGIAQGKQWLSEYLPEAEVVEVSSTAEGARIVAEGSGRIAAAVASQGAASVYGLSVLAESIQLNDDNVTRFYVLSTQEPMTEKADRIVFSAVGAAEGLPELMAAIEEAGMELKAIHDRPEKTTLGSYVYLIECENGGLKEYESVSRTGGFEFCYYGAFPMG
jgi:prephenate dehydratase/chorismate mutase/prephenate dehydratase